MKAIRACKGQFDEITAGLHQDKLFPVVSAAFHMGLLDGIANLDIVTGRLANEYKEIAGAYGATWSKDLSTLVAEVDKSCPAWESVRETLLDHPDVMEQMKANPSYGKIGRLCSEIRAFVKLVERVRADRRGWLAMPSHSSFT